MEDILNEVWLDNPVKMYIAVFAVIALVYLFKKYVSHYLAIGIFNLIKKTWPNVDKKVFIELLAKPLRSFILTFTVVSSLHQLSFPEILDIEIYRFSTAEMCSAAGKLLVITSFISLLLKLIEFLAFILKNRTDLPHDPVSNQLIVFFKDFFKAVIVIIGILLILKFVIGYNIGSLVTGISLVTAAVALALRESLENLIASFVIFFDKPFTMGDTVKVHSFTGTVEKIGLRSTRIRTDQKTYISVPNKQMVDSILDNFSLRSQRRADLRLELASTTPVEKVNELTNFINKVLQSEKLVENQSVFMTDISGNAYVVTAEYYTDVIPMADFNKTKETVNLAVVNWLESNEVKLAEKK